jgi:uncharacterized protein YkwD
MNRIKLNFVAAAFAATLVACGGGGGGGSTPTPSTPVVAATLSPATTVPIVTSVPAATYTAGSEEKAAFDLLNAERAACGFGLLAQNAALDTAATGHADWLLTNGYTGHYQSQPSIGFTGMTPQERAASAGYGLSGSFDYGEVESDQNGPKIGSGVIEARGLLNSPYHLMFMLRGHRDIGIAVRDKSNQAISPNNRHAVNIGMGVKYTSPMQAPAAGSIRTYPCNGSTGVDRQMFGENPNPVPGRNLLTLPLGSSIGIVADVGHTVTINNATMINVSTSSNVVVRPAITAANDPNSIAGVSYFGANEAYIAADAPLAALTTYQATINGTDNGVAFSRTFQFTTGN